jgi:periplasmic divalent cation tolerance protein
MSAPSAAATLSMVYVTAPDEAVALTLATELVKQRLAACVMRVPQVRSIFTWEGKLEEATEVLLMIKTETRLVEAITALVCAKHPYAVPEVISHPLSTLGNPAYLAWVAAAVAPLEATPINAAVVSPANGLALREQYAATKPFPLMRMKDMFSNAFLEDVYDALATKATFEPRANDLYLFMQSEDLRSIGERESVIKQLAELLYCEQMLGFLRGVTGIELNNQVDMSATFYTNGSHLLTHDDRESTRRVAFILYLTPKVSAWFCVEGRAAHRPSKGWSETDGGHLRCYYSDPNSRMPDPHRYTQFLPEWSTFAFFSVSAQSFHSVQEVTTEKIPRVAVSVRA